MANLTVHEKKAFETLFDMSGGYVLDFSNSTFEEFIYDSIGVRIYDHYELSKAKCLRSFIRDFEDRRVGRLLKDLLDYFCNFYSSKRRLTRHEEQCIELCNEAINRLQHDGSSCELPSSDDETLSSIMDEVNNALKRDKPEAALDRLHTFTTRYIREVCKKHDISISTINRGNSINKPLHSLLGELVKTYSEKEIIKSETAILIVKSSISVMERFNSTRNNESMAHDNQILDSIEAEFIVKSISSLLIFIEKIESSILTQTIDKTDIDEEDYEIPF